MKGFLRILAILLLLAAAGVGIFLATFDADRYRPRVAKKMEEALGHPVKLERISLGWKGGIAAELRGLEISPDLQVGSVSVLLRPLPLLRGDIQIGSVAVRGLRARLIRRAAGAIDVPGLLPLPAGSAPAASAPGGPAGQAAPLLIRDLRIDDGMIRWTDESTRPPLDLTLERVLLRAALDLRAERLEIKECSANLAQGVVHLNGVVRKFNTRPEGELNLKLENIRLEAVAPPAGGEAGLQGALSTTMEIRLQGQPASDLLKGLSASGQVRLLEGRLSNVNLLREAFDQLTVIPGLTDTLLSRLPPSYSQKLTEKDTLLQPVNLSFTLQNGAVSFQEFRAATDSFELAGSGQVGLDGGLNVAARIFLQPDLSAAFIQSVQELRFLADDSQRILLPVRLGGTLQKPAVSPDLQAIAAKLFSNKAEDLVGDLLNRVLEKKKKKEQPSGG